MEEQGDEFYDDDEVSELSSSPTIPEGEIDFNFVYALHTFLATVEGLFYCEQRSFGFSHVP